MVIQEFRIKLKLNVDVEEPLRLFNELAAPIYSKIPGCISIGIFRYEEFHGEQKSTDWDYAFITVWESKEAKSRAVENGTLNRDRKDSGLAKTGYYDKVMPMMERMEAVWHTPLTSM